MTSYWVARLFATFDRAAPALAWIGAPDDRIQLLAPLVENGKQLGEMVDVDEAAPTHGGPPWKVSLNSRDMAIVVRSVEGQFGVWLLRDGMKTRDEAAAGALMRTLLRTGSGVWSVIQITLPDVYGWVDRPSPRKTAPSRR